jgi:hypothetical protein
LTASTRTTLRTTTTAASATTTTAEINNNNNNNITALNSMIEALVASEQNLHGRANGYYRQLCIRKPREVLHECKRDDPSCQINDSPHEFKHPFDRYIDHAKFAGISHRPEGAAMGQGNRRWFADA